MPRQIDPALQYTLGLTETFKNQKLFMGAYKLTVGKLLQTDAVLGTKQPHSELYCVKQGRGYPILPARNCGQTADQQKCLALF